MKANLRKAIKAGAFEHVARMFPDSKWVEKEELPVGCWLWELNRGAGIWIYLLLICSPREDRFTFEIAWNTIRRYPQYTKYGPETKPESGQARFRLPRLWQRYGFDPWWHVGMPLRRNEVPTFSSDGTDLVQCRDLDLQLQDAFQKLLQQGVPYLQKIAEHFGATLRVETSP